MQAALPAPLFAALAAIAGCGGSSPTTIDTPPPPPEAVVEVLQREWALGNYVFRTPQSWSDAWYASPSLVIPETAPPQVDFSANMLVGVAAGWGPNGCAGLAIHRATEEAARILVEYSQSDGTPPPGTGCTAVLVQLVGFAKIPTSTKPVEFVRNDLP